MMKSIQSKLAVLMIAMLSAVLLVNIVIIIQSQRMIRQINRVFVSNVSIVELTDILDMVQESVYDYLNTRSSSSLENFYRYEQQYRDLITELNDSPIESESLMLEKNIWHMSESYLTAAEEAVQAKRGRDIEEYRGAYQSASALYDYINGYIYELNNLRFAQNSENYQVLIRVLGNMQQVSILLMLGVFAVSFSLAFSVIRRTIGPLRNLSNAANSVAAGNLDIEIPSARQQDEVGIVTDAFRKMITSIRQYIIDQRISLETEARMKENELSMEAHLKEAQLKYLQAQINPHFLFNSLNAGAQLAVMEDADRTAEFLARMADFFRYNVRKTEGDANLAEEIEAADNYIYILNVRFAGDIHYEKEIDATIDMEDVRMPSMILQPIVENAVQHGIHDNHDDGKITLYVDKVSAEDNETGEDCIRITVADNGMGLTREKLMIISRLCGQVHSDEETAGISLSGSEEDSDSLGIALANVIARLKLYYNKENLFSIWSDGPGCGTEVTVLLPKEWSGKEESKNVSNSDSR